MAQLQRDIWVEILRRCSIRSMIESKAVCPDWRDLIESPEFARFVPPIHIVDFRPISCIARPTPTTWAYRIIEPPGSDISFVKMGIAGCVPVVRSSVNGLILLLHRLPSNQPYSNKQHLWVCNPITREYLTIPNPPHYIDYDFGFVNARIEASVDTPDFGNYNFGFGVSRKSNEYKVVWISTRSEWHVFTLGTRGAEWRTLSAGPTLGSYHRWNTECVFLAGNLYWLDPDNSRILCFDLETEVFTTSSVPPPPNARYYTRNLCVLKERLCLCDVWSLNIVLNGVVEVEIEVWLLMNNDWSKEYVIKGGYNYRYELPRVFPVRVLWDGTVLFGERGKPFIYHFIRGDGDGDGAKPLFIRRNLARGKGLCDNGRNWYPRSALFTPNFVPLKTLLKGMEEEVQTL